MIRFIALALVLIGSFGCAGTMVQNPNERPQYAPKNYQQTGQVKYLNQGMDFIINKRREDAFEQMHTACGGDYEIINESNQATTRNIGSNGFGGLTVSDENHYVFLTFKCEKAVK